MPRPDTVLWSSGFRDAGRQFDPKAGVLGMKLSFDTPTQLATVALHDSESSLEAHVEKHYAFDQAISALHFAFPALTRNLSFASPRTLIRALRRDSESAEYRDLLDGYALIVRTTMSHARKLNWARTAPSGATAFFSPTGMLVVTKDGVLRTAFIAGLRDGQEPQDDRYSARRKDEALAPDDAPFAHFSNVFKPAIAMLKRAPASKRPGHPGEYGVLSDCEGIRRRLDFGQWLAFCATAGWTLGQEGGDTCTTPTL